MSRRSEARPRAVVAAAVALFVLVAVAPGHGAASTQGGEAPPSGEPEASQHEPADGEAPGESIVGADGREPLAEGDVRARMKIEDISYEEAEHRFYVERAAGVFQNTVAARWPETFGGLWVDVEDFGVVVAFTEGASARVEELRGEFAYPEALRPATVTVSLAELTQVHARIVAERAALSSGQPPSDMPAEMRQTGGQWDIDIDVEGNTLVVQVQEPSARLRQQFRDRYSQHLVLGTRFGTVQACTATNCAYNGRGGLRWYKGGTSH